MSFINLFNIVLEVTANVIRQEEKIRNRNIGEEKMKVFADCLNAYLENLRKSNKNYT